MEEETSSSDQNRIHSKLHMHMYSLSSRRCYDLPSSVGGAVRLAAAGDLEAHQGARTGRSDRAEPPRAVPTVPPRAGSPGGGGELG